MAEFKKIQQTLGRRGMDIAQASVDQGNRDEQELRDNLMRPVNAVKGYFSDPPPSPLPEIPIDPQVLAMKKAALQGNFKPVNTLNMISSDQMKQMDNKQNQQQTDDEAMQELIDNAKKQQIK